MACRLQRPHWKRQFFFFSKSYRDSFAEWLSRAFDTCVPCESPGGRCSVKPLPNWGESVAVFEGHWPHFGKQEQRSDMPQRKQLCRLLRGNIQEPSVLWAWEPQSAAPGKARRVFQLAQWLILSSGWIQPLASSTCPQCFRILVQTSSAEDSLCYMESWHFRFLHKWTPYLYYFWVWVFIARYLFYVF